MVFSDYEYDRSNAVGGPGFGGIGSGMNPNTSSGGIGGSSSSSSNRPSSATSSQPQSHGQGYTFAHGYGSGSIGRTNGYAVNLNMNGSGILGGSNPTPEERFSSLGSTSSGSSSVFDPGGYTNQGSAFAQREVHGQGQHPRSRMVFASQTFVPPPGSAGSSSLSLGGGPALSHHQQHQQPGQTYPNTSQNYHPQQQLPPPPPPSQQQYLYQSSQPQGIIQQPRYSNGHALGLGGIDDSTHPGMASGGGMDERSRGRQMSQMEKAIFGPPGTNPSGQTVPASVPIETARQGRMRGRPDTVVDRLLRREEDDDSGPEDEGDRPDRSEGRQGPDDVRGRGQPGRSDQTRENDHHDPNDESLMGNENDPGAANATNGRNPSRTRTRTRTRSKSKRRGGRSRSDSRNPSSRLAQSRGTSRSRGPAGAGGPGAGESDKEDVYGDRDGLGSGRGGKREGSGKKPIEREEISTIFMVGFPDDISEREFSNIFTFAHGFEAASLKFPNAPSVLPAKEATTPTLSLPLAVQQQLGIFTGEPMRLGESPSKRDGDDAKDDDESMIGWVGGEPVRALSAAAAAALGLGLGQNSTASSSTTSLVGMLNSANRGPPRRQVIGFARFRTRAEALVARDTLQGRKIDVFSSATLKVEMAKKNLHSRRGFGSGQLSLSGVPESEVMDVLMRSGKLPGLLAGMGMGGFVLSRERSNGSQGQGRQPESIHGGADLRSGASTPSGRRMSMSDSFATLTMAGSNAQSSASGMMQQSGGQPMPSLGQATEETTDFAPRTSFSGQMDQSAPVFSPRYASMEMEQTPMNNKTQKHRRNDSLRSVFSADWSNPLKLSQVPEHPFPSSAFGDRRSDEHLTAQLGSSLSGSAASGAALSGSSPASGIQSDRQASMLSSSDPTSPGPSFTSPMAYSVPKDSKALLALAEDDDEDWNVGGVGMEALGSFDGESRNNSPAPNRNEKSVTSPTTGYDDLNQATPGGPRRDDQSFVPRALTGLTGRRAGPGMIGPRSLSDFGGVASLNIADQNPPINTLYVGNLPSHLAVTQSANYLEECLRNLFTRASGFKRMSFRQKVNGPMCFVEFESVDFATLAIKDLYGNTLGGLVKGGLRLSYSKNSLGQRGNGQPTQPTRINTSHSISASDITSPGSYAAGGLSPSSSLNGIPYIANYVPGRNDSNDSAAASSFKSETPLSPLAVPFNSSALPHEAMAIATSPRLQRFPSSGSEGRQTRDGSLAPISPRAAFSAPWPMTSINPQASQYGAMNALGPSGYDNAFSRSS